MNLSNKMRLLIFTLGLLTVVKSQCPDPPVGFSGICEFTDANCLSDSECFNGQICCQHLCGKICKDKVNLTISKPGPKLPPVIIDPPVCPPVCEIYCLYGNVLDKNGCKTCKCKETPCDGEAPLTLDSNGNSIYCGRGGVSCPLKSECKIHPTDVYAVCCPKVCPPVCAIFCPNGHVLDDQGCPTCTCNGPLVLPPLPVDKPGNCPVPPSPFLVKCASIDRCKYDSECEGTQKCCDHPCGRQCRDIVKTKPGVCPKTADPDTVVCKRYGDECYQDSTCPGSQKCCQGACGNACMDARLTSTDHEGTCPALDPKVLALILCARQDPECELDSDCNLDEKCCQDYCGIKCVKSITKPTIKSGSCPIQKYQLAIACASFMADKCSHDGECPGNEKCCKSGCVKQCVDPQTAPPLPVSKPGSCPRYRYRCRRQQRNFCTTDDDCRGSRKCCKLPCGGRCRFPRRSPPNRRPRPSRPLPSTLTKKGCPAVKINALLRPVCALPLVPPCKVDSDCSKGEICCPGTCYNRCLKGPSAVVKPGVCPKLPQPIPMCFRFQNDCKTDSDCSGDQKCCSVACGIGCVSPVKVNPCPANPCGNAQIKCQYGQVKDKNGCYLCKCNQCPDGKPLVDCFANPCDVNKCDNPAGVRCVSNYCGGCNAVYYDTKGNEVNCAIRPLEK